MSTKTIEKLVVVVTALLETLLNLIKKREGVNDDAVANIVEVCERHGLPEDVQHELLEFV